MVLNWIDNPKSYYLPRIIGNIENKNIVEFTKDYGIDTKKILKKSMNRSMD